MNTDKTNKGFWIATLVLIIVSLSSLIGIGSSLRQKEKKELNDHIQDTQQEYVDGVQRNLWKLNLTPLEPTECAGEITFSAYVRNKSGNSIGNVYFVLTLFDENNNQIYKIFTSQSLGSRYYYLVNISINKKDCVGYLTYKWEMTAVKPII